jgi:hypothetical protein
MTNEPLSAAGAPETCVFVKLVLKMENEKEKCRADIMIARLRTPLFSFTHYLSHAHRYGHRTHAPTQSL